MSDKHTELLAKRGAAYRRYTAALARVMDARVLLEQVSGQVEVAHGEYIAILQELMKETQELTHRAGPELGVIQ